MHYDYEYILYKFVYCDSTKFGWSRGYSANDLKNCVSHITRRLGKTKDYSLHVLLKCKFKENDRKSIREERKKKYTIKVDIDY
ncbi:unnamed protein product [Callosobruchus maculatus]|uniref:Uncharacterized protein n=1 Tax=Callosobruchus maculatus TaxID=64391 RepID=A0A653DH15_CALMS|nr:unnamed protein product [Callosobruchus maculatus]